MRSVVAYVTLVSLALVSLALWPAGPASAAPTDVPPPLPPGLVAAFAPRALRLEHPTLARPELASVVVAHRAGKHQRACELSEALRGRLMREASAVFYGPDRRRVDIKAFDGFLDAHVHGKAPLLEVVGEVFAPVSAWRRLTLASCLRATSGRRGRAAAKAERAGDEPLQIALRFAAQAAWLGHDEPLRAAVAAAWLGLGRDPAQVRALFVPATTWKATVSGLMRAVLAPDSAARDAALARAAGDALPGEQALVAEVRGLLVPSPVPGPAPSPVPAPRPTPGGAP